MSTIKVISIVRRREYKFVSHQYFDRQNIRTHIKGLVICERFHSLFRTSPSVPKSMNVGWTRFYYFFTHCYLARAQHPHSCSSARAILLFNLKTSITKNIFIILNALIIREILLQITKKIKIT